MEEVNLFIEKQVAMIGDGFGLEQVRNNVRRYVGEQGMDLLRLDAMLDRSMELYGEIIRRSGIGTTAIPQGDWRRGRMVQERPKPEKERYS